MANWSCYIIEHFSLPIGELLVEAAITEGEETDVLLDEITGNDYIQVSQRVICRDHLGCLLEKIGPRFDGTLDGTGGGQRFEESLGLGLVLCGVLAELKGMG